MRHAMTLLLSLPMLGALALFGVPRERPVWVRRVALGAGTGTMLVAWSLLTRFEPRQAGLQLVEHLDWSPRLGMAYYLAVDGISLPMLLLATLLCWVALVASRSIKERARGYYQAMLALESALLGVFLAQDWSLFYLFWELTLIPLFFLIDRWGGPQRQGAALNFVLYTMGGSVFMLLGLLVLFDAAGIHSFGMPQLAAQGAQLPRGTQILVFLGLLVGFGVKLPLFPIHGWLPLAHVQAPSPVSILLSGILLKMGAYGLLRAVQTLPVAALALQDMLGTLALVSLLYGGLLAWRQTDLKAMIAYSSVSHMGVVMLGISSLNLAGLTGALWQMIAHGLVAAALFLLIGLLYERTHTRQLGDYGNLTPIAPRFAAFAALAFITAIGLPGTAGFVAELHTLVGGFQAWGWGVLPLSIGVVVGAAYAIRALGQLCTGPAPAHVQGLTDMGTSETWAAAILIGGSLVLGLLPAGGLDLMAATLGRVSDIFAGP